MSMLCGRLPSRTGILTNDDTLPDTSATFVHALAAAGYETTLVGRMHFIGRDQRHGFHNRLVGDTTPVTWNRPTDLLGAIRGVYRDAYQDWAAVSVVGGGDSPVLDYDRDVVDAALEYLSRPRDRPQFVLVGTYGPHFPYVAPPELYEEYLRAAVPAFGCDAPPAMNPVLARRAGRGMDRELVRRLAAAYCGMTERTDNQVGGVRAAFRAALRRAGRKGVFVYLSDHGDMCGERGMVGKNTFYERAVRIPLLFEGDGIAAGRTEDAPASLLDLGPTLCGLAGAPLPTPQDGRNLVPALTGGDAGEDGKRIVVSELLAGGADRPSFARMARRGRYKLVSYRHHEDRDALYDVDADPFEERNLAGELPDVAESLAAAWRALPSADAVENGQKERAENIALLRRAEALTDPDHSEMWAGGREASRRPPVVT